MYRRVKDRFVGGFVETCFSCNHEHTTNLGVALWILELLISFDLVSKQTDRESLGGRICLV